MYTPTDFPAKKPPLIQGFVLGAAFNDSYLQFYHGKMKSYHQYCQLNHWYSTNNCCNKLMSVALGSDRLEIKQCNIYSMTGLQ